MVCNDMHVVEHKDPWPVITPFTFDRDIKLASVRIGVDESAPKEFVDKLRELGAKPTPLAARPQLQGAGALGAESAAAFDSYVQWKAKELGIDLATIPEPVRGGAGGGGGGGGGGAGAPGGAGGLGAGGSPGNPTGMAALTRWT